MLVKAKLAGDSPPGELAGWTANMDEALAERLVALGLIAERHRARHAALAYWIDPWVQVVRGRKPESRRHAPQQGKKARRIIEATKARALQDLDADLITETINGFKTEGCKEYTAQVYNLVSADTIEGQIYLLLEQKLPTATGPRATSASTTYIPAIRRCRRTRSLSRLKASRLNASRLNAGVVAVSATPLTGILRAAHRHRRRPGHPVESVGRSPGRPS